jgi:hypothetical protein
MLTQIMPDEPQRLHHMISDGIPRKMQVMCDLFMIEPIVPAQLKHQPSLRRQ